MPFVTVARTIEGLDDDPSGNQREPILHISPADEVLVTWRSRDFGATLRFRVLDEDGDKLGTEFGPGFGAGYSSTLLANGDILILANHQSGTVFRYSQTGQVLDQSAPLGSVVGPPVELANGNILFTRTDGSALFGQILTPALDPVGAAFTISDDADQGSLIVPLAGGGFAVSQSVFNIVKEVQAYDANGAKVGPEQALTGFTSRNIEALPDGGYVVVGNVSNGPPFFTERVVIQTFNADGTARTTQMDVAVGLNGDIAVLDDQLFVVSSSSSNHGVGQLVHASGRVLGTVFDLGSDPLAAIGGIDADTFVTAHLGKDASNGDDVDIVYWQVDRPNILIGDATSESFDGAGAADRIMAGFGGDDVFHVDSAGDIVHEWAGEGNDTVLASINYQLGAGLSIETLATEDDAGTAAIDLTGNELAQTIRGNAGNNLIDGRGGVDVMAGLAGDDNYYVDASGEVVQEAAGEGNDRVFTSASYTLAAGVSVETLSTRLNVGTTMIDLTGNEIANTIFGNAGRNVLTGGAGNDVLDGKENSDTLYGGADNDILYGGGGEDQLYGGTGTNYMAGGAASDSYYVDSSTDTLVELAGEGADRVFASVSFALSAGSSVETLQTADEAGTAAINLTGNGFVNFLYGNAGANFLNGGGGADVLGGKGGDDQYVVDDAGDIIVDAVGDGNDRVYASLSYTLSASASVETLSTTDHAGTAAINLTGNGLANTIFGNAGVNVLTGGAGNDVLDGKEGNDTVVGGADNDILYGRDGNDQLSGGTGTNYLAGGLGDDLYFVDIGTDTVVELTGQGADRVYASVSYTLSADASVEILSTDFNAGTADIDLTGNALANIIFGNAGDNLIDGGAGKDIFDGKGGADVFLFSTALNTAPGATFAALATTANVDLIYNFAFDDKIGLDADLFNMIPGALAPGAFVQGTAAVDADDRIIFNAATGALMFDADGSGSGAAQLFAYLNNPFSLDASFFVVI